MSTLLARLLLPTLALPTFPAHAQLARWQPVAAVPGYSLYITQPPGDNNRLFVLDKNGLIRIIQNGQTLPQPFLDIAALTVTTAEQVLLGLAFHPHYQSNGLFYIYHNAPGSTIVEYRALGNPATSNTADPASRRPLLTVAPGQNFHLGGWLGFGPDGHLYASTGDHAGGGWSQNSDDLRGKVLRIDVNLRDPGLAYAIPPNNPFASPGAAGRDELWATGLRNPWRCSFDRQTGDLWIGDVGDRAWEEVNRQLASSEGGDNYGWNCWEGPLLRTCLNPPPDPVRPVHFYQPTFGISNFVVGGYVYRGTLIPRLHGSYIFGRQRQTWMLDAAATPAPGASIPATMLTTLGGVSFGEDNDGELYLCPSDLSGLIYQLVAEPCSPADLTSHNTPALRGYAQPNGVLTHDDFFYYLDQFAAANAAVADLTATAMPNTPGYAMPDGLISNDDFFYYTTLYAAGC